MLGRRFAIGLLLSLGVLPVLAEDGTFRLTNGLVYRELAIDQGVLRTTGWGRESNPQQSIRTLASTKEFDVDGLTTRDYRATRAEPNHPSDPPSSEITFDLVPVQPNHPKLRIQYVAVQGEPYLRKRIEIESSGEIQAIDVESLDVAVGGTGAGWGNRFMSRARGSLAWSTRPATTRSNARLFNVDTSRQAG